MQLITRAEWGAQYSNGEQDVTLSMRWQDNWLHHSVTAWLPPDATLAQEIAAIREIEGIGQREFGQGISYTRIIPASGRVFEGHGLDRRGAHTYRRNDSSRAICLIGNYENNEPTREQLYSVAEVLRDWHASEYCPRPALSGGHRDVYATACPGKHAYAAIPEINQLATSGEPLNLEDDLSGQGDNILAFIATGGSSTRASGPDGLSSDIDPSSLFGRVYDMQWALTRILPILVSAAQAGVKVDSSAVAQALVPALRDAIKAELQAQLPDSVDVDEDAVAKAVAARLGSAISAGAQ